MAKLRESFWILKFRSTVKKVIFNCLRCRRLDCRPLSLPAPPHLPAERVNDNLQVFEACGVDLTGHIFIADGESIKKYYIVLFICTFSRAVHLEVVPDVSASSFLNALRKFAARRGMCRVIFSDNASNLKMTSKLISQLSKYKEVQQFLAENDCKWKFIPAKSPHFGGFYERFIGVVKSCLRKVLYKQTINYDTLITLVTEIECKVNNRPLTYLESDLSNLEPLTPSHLLHGRRLNTYLADITMDHIPDVNFVDRTLLNKRFLYLNELYRNFKEIWKKEYLSFLLQRHQNEKHRVCPVNIRIGDIFLISDECPISMWKLGRVIKLYPGKDGIVRVVKLKTRNRETTRSVNKLYPLEISPHEIEEDTEFPADTGIPTDTGTTATEFPTRLSRKAARLARSRWQGQI